MKSRFLSIAMIFSFLFLMMGLTANAQTKTTKESPKKHTVTAHTKSVKYAHPKSTSKTHKKMTLKKGTMNTNKKKMTSNKTKITTNKKRMMKKGRIVHKTRMIRKISLNKTHTGKSVKKGIPKKVKKEGNTSSGNGK